MAIFPGEMAISKLSVNLNGSMAEAQALHMVRGIPMMPIFLYCGTAGISNQVKQIAKPT